MAVAKKKTVAKRKPAARKTVKKTVAKRKPAAKRTVKKTVAKKATRTTAKRKTTKK